MNPQIFNEQHTDLSKGNPRFFKNRKAGLPANNRQPGCLGEIRGFPSLPCDRFGFIQFL
jgi:hypothetical protein